MIRSRADVASRGSCRDANDPRGARTRRRHGGPRASRPPSVVRGVECELVARGRQAVDRGRLARRVGVPCVRVGVVRWTAGVSPAVLGFPVFGSTSCGGPRASRPPSVVCGIECELAARGRRRLVDRGRLARRVGVSCVRVGVVRWTAGVSPAVFGSTSCGGPRASRPPWVIRLIGLVCGGPRASRPPSWVSRRAVLGRSVLDPEVFGEPDGSPRRESASASYS